MIRSAAIAATLAGCYAPDVSDCAWTCEASSNDCPSGQSCIGGICRSEPDENLHCGECPGYPTGGTPDDFSLSTNAWGWDPDGGILSFDGRLRITPNTNFPSYARVVSTFDVLLIDRAVFVQLVAPATTPNDPTPPIVTSTFTVFNATGQIRLMVAGDRTISVERRVMGQPVPVGARDYDRARMQFLRMRESAGTLFLEALADPNEITGTVIHQEPTPSWLATPLRVSIGASASGMTGVMASPAVFDNFDRCE